MLFFGSVLVSAQSIGDTRNETATTHRIAHTFVSHDTVYGAGGPYPWSRDEHLNNQCYGNGNSNSHWTSPFSSIYSTEWMHFQASGSLVVPNGKIGYVEDTKTYTVYSETNATTAANELLGGDIYMLTWNGVNFLLGWVPFAWSRSEITWSARSSVEKHADAAPGTGGGG